MTDKMSIDIQKKISHLVASVESALGSSPRRLNWREQVRPYRVTRIAEHNVLGHEPCVVLQCSSQLAVREDKRVVRGPGPSCDDVREATWIKKS